MSIFLYERCIYIYYFVWNKKLNRIAIKLHVPLIKSTQDRRSFSYAAPFIWNNLTDELCSSPSMAPFHVCLKRHLFPPSILFPFDWFHGFVTYPDLI
jgi:hypothetical protein